jgi:hypothetical protein
VRKYILPFLVIILAIGCYVLGSRSEHERLVILELRASAEANRLNANRDAAEIERLRIQIEGYRKAAAAQLPKIGDLAAGQGTNNDAGVDLQPFLVKDPEYTRIHRQGQLRYLKRQYGDLKALNLPADQQQKLTDLLLDRNSTLNDAREAANQAGLKFGTTDFSKALADATKDDDDQIKSLLGPAGYQQLQDASSLNTARTQLQVIIGSSLNAAGTPLTNDQVLALAGIQVKMQNSPQGFNSEEFATLASQVLTPEQNATYTQNVSYQNDYNDMVQRALAAAKVQYGDIKSWHISGP